MCLCCGRFRLDEAEKGSPGRRLSGVSGAAVYGGGSDMAQFKAGMLWDSIDKADLTAVHGLLQTGNINLEERDSNGRTFLMVASEKGELNIVRELLEAGVDPNAVDNESWSALLCASKEGHLEIVIELLEHSAQLEHKDMFGWTALMWGSYKGRIIVVQELLDRGANGNTKANHHMTSLAWAAGRGHTEIVQMLIAKGAKVNTADKYGTTPLIWACRKGYVDIAEALLAEGSNADASGMNSWTPVLVATKGGHADVVHALLQHDPNVNATDKDGLTALAIAAREGHVEIVQDLLSKGAYVNVGDRAGDSILIHAVKGGQVDVVRALLDKYVDVDVQGAEDKTALYWAVEKGYNEIVRLLLASEPDLEISTKDEDTALLRGVRSRNEDCVRMLLEKGSKVSSSDKRGDTALHIAIRARSKRITELLLRNPRNSRLLYRPNRAGETPYAMDTYHQRGILQGIYGHRNLNASDAENLLGYDIYSSALADILSDPSLATPITVGLYAKWGSGKSFLISKLQSEMRSFTQQSVDEHFSLTWTVVLVALFLSLVVGEALVLGVGLKVGIGVSVAIFVLQLIFFGAVRVCSQRYDMKLASRISTVLGQRQRLMMLLLRMLFCNPRRAVKADKTAPSQYSVRFLFSDCTRLSSVGGEKSLAGMIATLCQAVEREYGFLVTRLFRVYKPQDNNQKKGGFKSLCCVPYLVLVLLVLACVGAGVALLVLFPLHQHHAVDGVLIAIAAILTLTLVGNIYTWAQTLMALVSSQKRRVLKAADRMDSLKIDGFLQCLKQEVELMSRMLTCMDAFTADQTRLVVIVDGLDSCEQGKVLQVLDLVKALFSEDGAPFITILAVDPHIIIKGIEQHLKNTFQDSNVNGFDYLRNVVHLPFYLQSQGVRLPAKDTHNNTTFHNDDRVGDRERAVSKLGPQESVISTTSLESKSGVRRKGRAETLTGSTPQIYASNFDLTNTFARNDYFSDINPRSMRRLMNIVSVTARLLRAYNIDFNWHRLAAWINVIEQWPYRLSWVIYLFEEADVLESSTSLNTLYQRVLPRIPVTKESEPLLEIDRNTRKLEAFLASAGPNLPRLNVGDLRTFLPCTINLDPYLRKLIRETEHQNEVARQEMSMFGGGPPNFPPGGSQTFLSGAGPLGQQQQQGSSMGDTGPLLSWNRLPPQGSSPNRLQGSRVPSSASGVGVHHPSVTFAYQPASSSSLTTVAPALSHPSLFFTDTALSGWMDLDVAGVCGLIGSLKGVTPEVLGDYSARVRDANVSGLVLQTCDLDELRPVLALRFGDWQLFRAAILSLRQWSDALQQTGGPDAYPGGDPDRITSSSLKPNSSANMSDGGGSSGRKESGGACGGGSGGARAKISVETFQQGRGVGGGGKGGGRMRRNDTIAQQLSYEAAILHEALEEFPEDSDEGVEPEEEEDALSLLEMIPGSAAVLRADNSSSNAHPRLSTSQQQPLGSGVTSDLSSMITVLDAPSPPAAAEGGAPLADASSSEAAAAQFSPFLYQSSFPSDARLPEVEEVGVGGEVGEEPHPHHHKHQHHSHLLNTLASGLEKVARPILHVFDHHHHHPHHHHRHGDAETPADRIALMPMAAEALSIFSADNTAAAQEKEGVSAWDRSVFRPQAPQGPPGPTPLPPPPHTEVTMEVVPAHIPVFCLGGDDETEPSSPTSPTSTTTTTLTVESEIAAAGGGGAPSLLHGPRLGEAALLTEETALWQLNKHAVVSPDPHSPPDADVAGDSQGAAKDRESFV